MISTLPIVFQGLPKGGNRMIMYRPFSIRIRDVFLAFFTVSLLFTMGCQTLGPQNNQATTQLSNELEEANQKIEEMYHRLSVVQFMVDTHERTIADLERKLRAGGFLKEPLSTGPALESAPMAGKKAEETRLLAPESEPVVTEETLSEPGVEESAETLYNQGFAALKEKNYTRAISLFKTVVSKYPDHNLADNAIYWTGEIHYTQHNYEEAIRTFNRLIETYPDGGKVPDALLKIGFSYHSMGDKENAVKYLKKVVVEYPFTVPGSKAEAMLNRIE